ncbi:MAG TPA: CBASS oligonucleotide cyclase [Terriglobales bacterium]|nr:CBASS oligonucleotide cyclase [Terriglobales bacterium]
MKLTDADLGVFIKKVLKLDPGKRKEYLRQVDYLIERLEKKINEDSSFSVLRFTKTGSLTKGTVLRPRDGCGVDADVAVDLDISEAKKDDVDLLHQTIRKLLIAVYPQKKESDFEVQPRTLGIHFHDSGLDVDLVPVVPIPAEPGYGWQPSSQGDTPVKTSVKGQLKFIKDRSDRDPRFRPLVRLLKRWRNHQELEKFRSFTIELLLAALIDTQGTAPGLEEGLQRFFLFVAQTELKTPVSFPENGNVSKYPSDPVVILDPVNSENNVARRLQDSERKEIVAKATSAWETISAASWKSGKGDTLELWKQIFGRSFVIEE